MDSVTQTIVNYIEQTFDDAQANLAGHFSTVLYSALLAVLEPYDTWHDFLRAYIIGAELEGIIGSLINPAHRTQGWHSTGTVGVIGAAAAIGALRGLHGESLAQLLSLAATQSAGMFFQSGTDGKPLHAGLAARNVLRMCLNTTTFHQIQRNKINVDYVPPPISPFGMR